MFLVTVIDFDLPTVEIDLQQLLDGILEIGGQQESRQAVIQLAALTFAVGSGRHHQQSQWTSARAAFPLHHRHLDLDRWSAGKPAGGNTACCSYVCGREWAPPPTVAMDIGPRRLPSTPRTPLCSVLCATCLHRKPWSPSRASHLAAPDRE